MTNTREEVAVAEAIMENFVLVQHGGNPPDISMDGLEIAVAAIAASNSKYVAGLVEALKAINDYAQHDDDCKINDWQNIPECTCGYTDAWGKCQEALNNLPEELRG